MKRKIVILVLCAGMILAALAVGVYISAGGNFCVHTLAEEWLNRCYCSLHDQS